VSPPPRAGIDMKLSNSLGTYPAARPLNADQILEYHAARLLLLIQICGTKGQIDGLTKVAKLDFFVRYPVFFKRAATELQAINLEIGDLALTNDSAMIRHHYGPWDPRYYQVLAYLEGRELLTVEKKGKKFVFTITASGQTIAKELIEQACFQDLVIQMKKVKSLFGSKSGDWLKNLVYRVFDDEVAKLAMGKVIR